MALTESPGTTQDGIRAVHLRRGGTSVLLHVGPGALPTVLHWGAALPDDTADTDVLLGLEGPVNDSLIYAQPLVAVLPQHGHGWLGQPGLLGSRHGRAWSVDVAPVAHRVDEAGDDAWPDGEAGATRLVSVGTDGATALEVRTELEVHPSGIVRLRAAVTNLGDADYAVHTLEPALPVPASASELLDMAGRHSKERVPQRHPFSFGRWARESWGGRPGHDNATVLCAGVPGFAFRHGTVWGVHLAWSGNGVMAAEKTPHGWHLLRGGELMLPDEVTLAPGKSYTSPWLVGSWGEGLDQLQGRFHAFLRARPRHPRTPRPVILNTWEAVYFDQDETRLKQLADRAAVLGVERFVLDDGWFRGRRSDTAGLGDWYVDADVWPDGLGPLVDHVHELGMQFGLWFEPEMVNLDSDLARAHPEWVFATENGPGLPSRYQHVLDLGHPEAYEYVLARMASLVEEHGIDYIKWDHNRPLIDAGHQPTFVPGVHGHTLAVYRLIAALKDRFPGLEIESCCGGGGRIDLGIMDLCDRVWVSDCIDAHERQRLQRWTSLLLPPEVLGTHIGATEDHSTGRVLDLDYRAGTAIWGHFGIEWDLLQSSDAELERLTGWVTLHKELRGLLHTGSVVHADIANPVVTVEGVVAQDLSDAVYRMAVTDYSTSWPLGRITLPGLDPARRYRVEVMAPTRETLGTTALPGWAVSGATLSGALLADVGLTAPTIGVDRLVLIRARAV